jgi:hypothetical protein
VLAFALLAGFVFHASWVIPVWAIVLAVGVVLGLDLGPFHWLFEHFRSKLGPATALVDPRPHRFAELVETVLLAVGTLFLAGGEGGLAWIFGLTVAAVGALAASTAICLGCELYSHLQHRGARGPAG